MQADWLWWFRTWTHEGTWALSDYGHAAAWYLMGAMIAVSYVVFLLTVTIFIRDFICDVMGHHPSLARISHRRVGGRPPFVA